MRIFLLTIVFFGAVSALPGQLLCKQQVLEDLHQFETVMVNRAAYLNLCNSPWKSELDTIRAHLSDSLSEVDFVWLLQNVLGNLCDRQASLRHESTHQLKRKSGFLPFEAVSFRAEKILALKGDGKGGRALLHSDFPFVKSINGMPIHELIYRINMQHRDATAATSLSHGAFELMYMGYHLRCATGLEQDSISCTFYNEEGAEKITTMKLTERPLVWAPSIFRMRKQFSELSELEAEGLFMVKDKKVGYIRIPKMYNVTEAPKFYVTLEKILRRYAQKTKALVIDLRGNPGGSRSLLNVIAPHLIPVKTGALVANVAKLRTDSLRAGESANMRGRYLLQYQNADFSEADRKLIDVFMMDFQTSWQCRTDQFSQNFYMVLRSGPDRHQFHYEKPVYLLVNEFTSKSASVFTEVLGRLPNVRVAGVQPDGSCGKPSLFTLRNCHARLKVSTMAVFQANGRSFEGNGTVPDYLIHADMAQILNGKDSQLETLLKLINEEN